jgi:hydantoinase/carbamoylase family amidase
MSRLALTEADKEARDWFISTAKEFGCETTIDSMGNIFAIRKGTKSGPPTVAGSHLDTQPQGGRYDGILGICAGLEMLKVLNENWIETEYSVGVVNWTNEEGARFPISMLSSAVYSGLIPISTGHSCVSITEPKIPLLSALQAIDYHGKVPCSFEANPIAAHFELHIEQGPILESNSQSIGIVTGAQAYRWFTINLTGASSHTGTTPLDSRKDALLAASKMILYSNRSASRHSGLASTGVIEAGPSSVNSVAGDVKFTLDIRAPQDDIVDSMEADILSAFSAISAGEDIDGLGGSPHAISISITKDSNTPATTFHPDCIQCVSDSAANLFGPDFESRTRTMTSGAGHDSVMTNLKVPTSMIFVPSKDGISHNPKEYTSPPDCALGAQVLLGAVLRYDRLRAMRGR